MDKLDSELQRLHFLPVDQPPLVASRLSASAFLRAADWPG